VKLEIISPKEGTEIYVGENGVFEEPLKITIRVTNLGDAVLNLNSTLELSLSLDSQDVGVEIWHENSLKLKPNESFEIEKTLNKHVIYTKEHKLLLVRTR